MHGKFGQHLPERALFCREEEEVMRPDIYGAFLGRMPLPAVPRNNFPGAADPTSRP